MSKIEALSKRSIEIIEKMKIKRIAREENRRKSTIVCPVPGCGKQSLFSHLEGAFMMGVLIYICPDGHRTARR